MVTKSPKAKVLSKHPVMPPESKITVAKVPMKKPVVKKVIKAKKKLVAKKK